MKLLTKEIEKKFPAWESTDGNPLNTINVVVKFFTPYSNWPWYITEYDGEDTFFGLCCGSEAELGYVSLKELSDITGPMGLKIERDISYSGTLLDAMKTESKNGRHNSLLKDGQ